MWLLILLCSYFNFAADRLKKMRLKFSGARSTQEEQPEVPELPEQSRDHTVVTMGGNRDPDSQSTRGDYAAPRQEVANDRTKQFTSESDFCYIAK